MNSQGAALLAQLPQPVVGSNGRTTFGPSFGLSGSRKRKRFEIAAAIDGETLNIYSLLSSYPIPPTTSFQCPPTSLSLRDRSGSNEVRYTVCALQGPEFHIRCFREATASGSDIPTVSSYTHTIDEQSPVCYVDLLPVAANGTSPESQPDVIVVHEDATVRRYSGDLRDVRWTLAGLLETEEQDCKVKVVHAQWVGNADAGRGLLRRRGDILRASTASNSSFLLLVYLDDNREVAQLRMGVFEVPVTSGVSFSATKLPKTLRLLLKNLLPQSRRRSEVAQMHFHFHVPTARLSLSHHTEVMTYDLSRYEIRVPSRFATEDGFSSIFPMTGNLAAGLLRPRIQIYNEDFKSVQASYDLRSLFKRKSPNHAFASSIQFISYFARIRLLVAVLGRHLVGFQLPETKVAPQKAQAGSLLIDSLGRGAYRSRTGDALDESGNGIADSYTTLFVPNAQRSSQWARRKKELDELVTKDQIDDFERAMITELNLEKKNLEAPHPDNIFVGHDRVTYLLSKMFRTTIPPTSAEGSSNQHGLDLVIVPGRLFRWLARGNHLSTNAVERAVLVHPGLSQLALGSVARSILDHDPSLGLLLDYVHGANMANVDEVVVGIKAVIKNGVEAEENESVQRQLLLDDGRTPITNVTNADDRSNQVSRHEPAMTAGGFSELHIRAMNRMLEALCTFSSWKVTSAISRHLDNDETLALIQYLRQQLFRSGHTSSNLGASGAYMSEVSVPPLETIASALSSCIDALGPSQPLGSVFDEGTWQGLVPDLKVEISLALGGVEEAVYLRGVLQEMVRYGHAAGGDRNISTKAEPSTSSFSQPQLGPGEMTAETAMRVDSERAEEEGQQLRGFPAMLPLNLGLDNRVTRTKKRKGGGEVQQRSAREMHYLRDRKVGLYSFERIVV